MQPLTCKDVREFAHWHHLNEMTIAAGKTPSDSEIDFEATAWNKIEAALVVPVKLGDMPSYGRASANDMLAAVHEAIYGNRDGKLTHIDDERPIGHQMVGGINFNSLNRIVTAFVNGSKETP